MRQRRLIIRFIFIPFDKSDFWVQGGNEAEETDNLFYYLSYEGAVDLDSVHDLKE